MDGAHHADAATLRLVAQQPRDVLLMRGIQVRGRLVEQQDGRLDREHASEMHPLALAARQGGQPPRRPGERAGRRHGAAHGGIIVGFPVSEPAAVREPAEGDHLGSGEIGDAARSATATQAGAPARAAARLAVAAPEGKWFRRAPARGRRALAGASISRSRSARRCWSSDPAGIASDTPSSTMREP